MHSNEIRGGSIEGRKKERNQNREVGEKEGEEVFWRILRIDRSKSNRSKTDLKYAVKQYCTNQVKSGLGKLLSNPRTFLCLLF